jgi:hypothetical protein
MDTSACGLPLIRNGGQEMAEVFRVFDEPVTDASGSYHARVVGRRAEDGMWEGWLEFVGTGGTSDGPFVSSVESRQPEREHLAYWAGGLSVVYMEGALRRARTPQKVRTQVIETPISDRPRPRARTVVREAAGPGQPILDPFEVGARNLDVLAQELGALGSARLLNIISAYRLNTGGEDLTAMTEGELIQLIVDQVASQLTARLR